MVLRWPCAVPSADLHWIPSRRPLYRQSRLRSRRPYIECLENKPIPNSSREVNTRCRHLASMQSIISDIQLDLVLFIPTVHRSKIFQNWSGSIDNKIAQKISSVKQNLQTNHTDRTFTLIQTDCPIYDHIPGRSIVQIKDWWSYRLIIHLTTIQAWDDLTIITILCIIEQQTSNKKVK